MLTPLLALALVAAPWRADAPKTHEIDLPRFHIQATDAALGTANLLANELEQDRDQIATRMGADYPGVTEVRVGEGIEEVLRLELPTVNPPRWAAGLAHPQENLILLDASQIRNDRGGVGIVLHELAHLAVAELGSPELPRWLQEGLAIRIAGETSQEEPLVLLRAAREPIPLAELDRGFPEGYGEVQLAYAESKDFVEFLAEQPHGPESLRKLLEAVHAGTPFDAAFAASFGPRAQLESDWLTHLKRDYRWVPFATGSSVLFCMTSLLCIFAWARVRRRQRTRMAELALEEQAMLAAQRIHAAEEAMPQPSAAEPPPSGGTKPTLH
ncbi:MAG: hypothetical protein JST54_19690 [Deltaproteobacteria bacterium]|nr:hypothetical protein [Deltaproteobacteria bacterium]